MCGIFGAVGRDLPDSAVEKVFDVLHYRGPDGRGLFVDESARLTLAHTRLAVLDLVSGAQPLQSDDGNIVLVANGEIYDFEHVRKSLEAQGHHFNTNSDSEVILYLYKQYGLACFEHLRGEFAFLLYDRAKRLLIAARDRFGIKPLYFSRLAGGFVFASEMKAIFASGLVAPKLDVAALDPLLDPDPEHVRFPFEGIEHVPPGAYVVIDLETLESRTCRYWSAEIPAETAETVTEPSGKAREAAAASVLSDLEQAVRLRLRADVPVGLYLSGGVDSAFVGALMQRNLDSRLHSFSISFEGSGRNEQEFARRAADFIGTNHHEFTVTRPMLWDNLEQSLWCSELPFATLAPVGKFLLSEEARRFVTVVLTGEGADEVFLGYRSFFAKALRETRRSRGPKRSASTQLRRLKLRGFSAAAAQTLSLLMLDKNQRQRVRSARAAASSTLGAAKPLVNAVQEARIAGMPLDILCYLGDREEMAHSLEARLPFLDHRLYETARDIPADFKLSDGVEKAVLRDAAKGILPEDLRLRRKSGFMLTSDAVDLFGADRKLTESLQHHLSKEAFERAGVFSYRAYLAIGLLARTPGAKRLRFVKRLRGHSNKVIMYMMQVHMLHDMFIADPRWNRPRIDAARSTAKPESALALTA
jgi:asparagine synthase (glutamine-hydrolysing)